MFEQIQMTPQEKERKIRECIDIEAPMIMFHINDLSFDFIREWKDKINGEVVLKYQKYSLQHLTQKQIDELRRYYRVFD